jgi:hypothetical protein
MALPIPPINPNTRIPNDPFYSPETYSVNGPYGPLVIGSGLTVDFASGVLSATGGGGGGAVNQILAGSGISVSPSTGIGNVTVSTPASGVTAGSYTNASFTVNSKGVITAASSGPTPLTSLTGTAPINVTGGGSPVISINPASTTGSGAVQLYNNTNSTSTSLALTAAQGKLLQDQISGLLLAGNLILGGTIDASTSLVDSVTSAGSLKGYAVGSTLPVASALNKDTYAIVTTPGTMTPPGGTPVFASRGDWFLSSEISPGVYKWTFLNIGFDASYATTTNEGVVCLSTDAMAQVGTDTTTALTPAAAASAYIKKACVTAKGSILTGTASSTPAALAVGANGQTLVACSACPTGLTWSTGAGIPCSTLTAKGDIVVASAANTPVALPVGINNQVLVACSTAVTGLCWVTVPAALPATPTGLGTVLGCTTATYTAVGCNALVVNTGAENTAVGLCALASNTTASNNTAVGSCSLRLNTTGARNVAFGAFALEQGTTTNDNIGIGVEALRRNATGCCNIAIGTTSLVFNTNGVGNIAIGLDAMRPQVTGSYNVAVGTSSFSSSTAGDFNVGVGTDSHGLLTTGNRNVAVGPNVNVTLPAGNCQLAIGFANGQNWLTGDSNKHIQPGAGIRDCTGSLGLANQVLSSTGSAVVWTTSTAGTGWVTAGTVQSVGIAAVYGNGAPGVSPVIGTTTRNEVRYRQIGAKEWQVEAVLFRTNGGTAGSGWYLLTLPGGLQFDLSSPFQQPYTDYPNDGLAWMFYGLANSYARASQTGATTYQQSSIVPYDATRYRIMFVAPNTDYWSSSYYSLTSTPPQGFKWSFTFSTP